ncbi:unnamed protein product [Chrysodeixis includens]|uniref:Uncharacterized protein n=1 Tax=Chrysodeixis includens TaxID=689277 RepID=A0A9N8Q0M5_CHRIL|nr:unnamed protein product [Chrysodeixis includens]
MSCTRLATVFVLLSLAAASSAIKCWKCGQYSDGVGSITPCSNRTATRLEECPSNAKYCIIYLLNTQYKPNLSVKDPSTYINSKAFDQKQFFAQSLLNVRPIDAKTSTSNIRYEPD